MSKSIPINNIHHVAFRCRDAEQTRWFYEDVLGLKLAAAMSFDNLSGNFTWKSIIIYINNSKKIWSNMCFLEILDISNKEIEINKKKIKPKNLNSIDEKIRAT